MSLINDSISLLINVLHLIVIIFILGAPFSGSNYLLFMHTVFVPFIMLHWLLNNNTCSLTLAEKYIREATYGVKTKDEECFAYKVIVPIYDFNKNFEAYSYFTWSLTFGLWSISLYTLIDRINSGQIKSFTDLAQV